MNISLLVTFCRPPGGMLRRQGIVTGQQRRGSGPNWISDIIKCNLRAVAIFRLVLRASNKNKISWKTPLGFRAVCFSSRFLGPRPQRNLDPSLIGELTKLWLSVNSLSHHLKQKTSYGIGLTSVKSRTIL